MSLVTCSLTVADIMCSHSELISLLVSAVVLFGRHLLLDVICSLGLRSLIVFESQVQVSTIYSRVTRIALKR